MVCGVHGGLLCCDAMSTEDRGSMFKQNVGIHLQVHMVSQPRRPQQTVFHQISWEGLYAEWILVWSKELQLYFTVGN
jgi:hypothetical protein